MAQRKRKKNTRQRGSHTHGWGSKKKHRGAGNRGGRGMAGTGKRADQMKPMFWKEKYFGSKGFVSKISENYKAINLLALQNHIDGFVKEGKAKLSGHMYEIDLSDIGYDILLSKGKVFKKLNIKVQIATNNAIKRVHDFGGSVQVSKAEEEKIISPKKVEKTK